MRIDASVSLYETDFALWSAEQAAALRAAALRAAAFAAPPLSLDWQHVAEEIEDLGRSLRRELASRTGTVIEHLLKLECSSSPGLRASWVETITRTRGEIERLVDDSPSLRRDLPDIVEREEPRARRNAAAALIAANEPADAIHAGMAAGRHSPGQVYGEWFPG